MKLNNLPLATSPDNPSGLEASGQLRPRLTKCMKHYKTYYKTLSIERKDNKYNKYLKWELKTILMAENEDNLIPLTERQVFSDWYKTEKEAKQASEQKAILTDKF